MEPVLTLIPSVAAIAGLDEGPEREKLSGDLKRLQRHKERLEKIIAAKYEA